MSYSIKRIAKKFPSLKKWSRAKRSKKLAKEPSWDWDDFNFVNTDALAEINHKKLGGKKSRKLRKTKKTKKRSRKQSRKIRH